VDAAAIAGPLTPPTADSPLVEVTAQGRAPRIRTVEIALVVVICAAGGGLYLWGRFQPSPDPATAVAAALEDAGYGPVRLTPDEDTTYCGYEPYRWSTGGAEGRACFHDNRRGTVDIWVDRDWRRAAAVTR
jgi:hypothetical protein